MVKERARRRRQRREHRFLCHLCMLFSDPARNAGLHPLLIPKPGFIRKVPQPHTDNNPSRKDADSIDTVKPVKIRY